VSWPYLPSRARSAFARARLHAAIAASHPASALSHTLTVSRSPAFAASALSSHTLCLVVDGAMVPSLCRRLAEMTSAAVMHAAYAHVRSVSMIPVSSVLSSVVSLLIY